VAIAGLLPSAEAVTAAWVEALGGRKYDYVREGRSDLPRMAQLMEVAKAPLFPHDELVSLYKNSILDREHLKREDNTEDLATLAEKFPATLPPGHDPHRLLADLPIKTYVTANYDPLLYVALKRGRVNGATRAPRREYCHWKGAEKAVEMPPDYNKASTIAAPTVFHLFGVDNNTASMVLTEDDYLEFIRNVAWSSDADCWRIPAQIRLDMTESMLLFLGFRAFDLNFRVMFKAVILNLRSQRDRYAVLQLEPGDSHEEERKELEQFLEKELLKNWRVTVVWRSMEQFLMALGERVKQLGRV
jgi:hypothetical protein